MIYQIYESGNYLIIDTYDEVARVVTASAQYAKKNSYYNKTVDGYVITEFGGGEFAITSADIAANLWTDNAAVPLSESEIVDILQNQTGNFKSAGGSSSAVVGAKPLKTGQLTIYLSEDDGATQRGRLVDFFTLSTNNAFGNTKRFTDLTGGQTYASNGVLLDHSTDDGREILAFTNSPTNSNWADTIALIQAQTTDGKTDWYMPNRNELNLLINEAANPNLNWSPLTTVATPFTGNIYCWTSTTPISNTARAKAFYSSTAIDGNEMRTVGKTLGLRALACRYYTYAELGL